jgi:integrase
MRTAFGTFACTWFGEGLSESRASAQWRSGVGEWDAARARASRQRSGPTRTDSALVRTRQGAEQAYRVIEATDSDAMRKRQATTNRIMTVLKAALNLAHENRRINSKAAWEAVKPFRAVNLPKVRFLTPAEVTALTTACEPDFEVIVKAALLTGCRYGELTALRIGAFNSDSKTLFIEKSKNGSARHVALNDEGVTFFSQTAKGRLRIFCY